MGLPDFIIGGAPKCGTSALFEYLAQHTSIFTVEPKEPQYYVTKVKGRIRGMNYSKKEYKSLFDRKGRNQVSGEASTSYLFHANSAAPEIAKEIPSVKLIFLLRSPIERDCSEYWFRVYVGDIKMDKTFSECVLDPNHWLSHGSQAYLKGLKTFYSYFGEDQILVLLTEDLRENRRKTLSQVCQHIGVDTSFDFDLSVRHNVTKHPRSVRLCRWIGQVAPGLSRWASKKRWLRWIRSGVLFSEGAKRPPIAQDTREKLANRYSDQIEELERLIGRDLSHWI